MLRQTAFSLSFKLLSAAPYPAHPHAWRLAKGKGRGKEGGRVKDPRKVSRGGGVIDGFLGCDERVLGECLGMWEIHCKIEE